MFRHLFGASDAVIDSPLVLSFVGIAGMLAVAGYEVLHGVHVGLTELGTGLAAVIGSGGAVRVSRDHFCPPIPPACPPAG